MAKLNDVLDNGYLKLLFFFLTAALGVVSPGLAAPNVNMPVLLFQGLIAGITSIGSLFVAKPFNKDQS